MIGRKTFKYRITPPLLYRLIDEAPHLKHESKEEQEFSLTQFYDQICQNIENILNARQNYIKWPNELSEIDRSVLNYGIEDFTLNYYGNKQNQIRLCQKIKEVISYFEQRIQAVKVEPVASDVELERILRIRIECEVILKPFPLHVIFESSFDITKQTFYVES